MGVFIAAWTEDIEALVTEGAKVVATCGCGYRKDVDLPRLIEERGPRFSLWNRTPPCPEGCGRRISFYALRPGGSWKLNLWGAPPGRVEPLHDRWHATLPKAERDKHPASRLMRNTGGKLSVTCPLCSWEVTIEDALEADAWGAGVSIERLRKIFRSMCGRPACRRDVDLLLPPSPPPL